MNIKGLALSMALLCAGVETWAQQDSLSHPWQQYFYELAANEDDGEGLDEEAFETLCQMESQPMDVNTATREDLERLPFLSERQVEDILDYIYTHGAMLSLGELTAIRSIGYYERQMLYHFVRIGERPKEKPLSLAKSLHHLQGTALLSASIPTYDRRGDKSGYLGYKYRHSLRLTFKATERLRAGFSAAQDAGEPFFAYGNKWGYDHYAYFIQLRQVGILQNLIVGHYNVQWGMGLVANTGFSLGKQASLTSLGRVSSGFRASASRSSTSYFQGVAATVSIGKHLKVSGMASLRPHDATLNKDGESVATIVKTGYHRTTTELARKNNLTSTSAGLNVTWRKRGFHLGASSIYTHLSRTLLPNTSTTYRRYYPQGNDFLNASIDYGYCHPAFTVSGETATDKQGHIATINSVALTLPFNLNIIALYRHYPVAYASLHASSLSDGGYVRNEQGFYVGAEWKPNLTFRLSAYADYAKFPWARYRVSRPSSSFDGVLSSSLQIRRRWTLAARYRLRARYRDNDAKTAIIRHTGHRARLSVAYDGGSWTTTTQLDYAVTEYKERDRGFMLTQQATWHWRWLQASLSAGYFKTDSYESRLYAYERGLLYSYGVMAFSGHGLRTALTARADISTRWMLSLKAGFTHYYDRDVISSGLQQIDSPNKTDIDLQARWKF